MSLSENWGRSLSVDLLKKWPKGDNGEPELPTLLCRKLCVDMDDELMINMLEAYGIPCFRQYVGNGAFGKVVLGMSGEGVDIYVPESLLEDAKSLISADPQTEE